ncbi:interleukin-23 subunit alpha [Podarcis lilfordi]|uniref:Interleukin-23 subunit alpha n=1 Tax=Podarcis lilfordi TaxID=74358 RepID=A0AA35JV51_9SAUR|nr:interleukin-23 subunit alpha [Podarcis lilfordi]
MHLHRSTNLSAISPLPLSTSQYAAATQLNKGQEANTSVSLPQRIECSDKCDPDSLDNNKMGCLGKIQQGLHHYHELLVRVFPPTSNTELKNTLYKLLQLVSKVGGNMESSSPDLPPISAEWQKQALQDPILLRLQSFAVVVARVISHCAALARNAN